MNFIRVSGITQHGALSKLLPGSGSILDVLDKTRLEDA